MTVAIDIDVNINIDTQKYRQLCRYRFRYIGRIVSKYTYLPISINWMDGH